MPSQDFFNPTYSYFPCIYDISNLLRTVLAYEQSSYTEIFFFFIKIDFIDDIHDRRNKELKIICLSIYSGFIENTSEIFRINKKLAKSECNSKYFKNN